MGVERTREKPTSAPIHSTQSALPIQTNPPLTHPPSPSPPPQIGDELVDPTGRYRIHKTHSARNVGTTVFKEMLIEKKKV